MKSSAKKAVTLENIGQLIDKKLDQKLDQKLAPVINDLDALKFRVEEINADLGARINNVAAETQAVKAEVQNVGVTLKTFKEETQGNFDVVYDGLTLLANTMDKDIDPRLKRAEQRLFA